MDRTKKIIVYKGLWPASVLLPGGRVWHRCRVYVTNQGLAIYARRADEPHYFSPMDWTATREPHMQRQVGIDLHTADGLVVATLTSGCGCGSSLKSWRPDWANTVSSWPSEASA